MKLGFTCSSWDLLHAGHILLLREAKQNCDYLIVGIKFDPSIDQPHKNKPVESIDERIIKISAVKYIDNFFVYNTECDLYDYLSQNENGIDIRFLGSDYLGQHFTGDQLNIETFYHYRDHNYSSSNLINNIIDTHINII